MLRTPLSPPAAAVAAASWNQKLPSATLQDAPKKPRHLEGEQKRVPVLVRDFALLLIGLNQNPSITNKMRVPFSQNELHCLWINEGYKPEHPLLLIWDPHILNWTENASTTKQNSDLETNRKLSTSHNSIAQNQETIHENCGQNLK